MQSEFESISTYNGWSTKLAELLAAARQASDSKSESERFAIVRRLTAFIEASSPASPAIIALDDIASAAARQLSNSIAGEALDRIAARTLAIEALSTKLNAITGSGSAVASGIELKVETRVAGALSDAARSISDIAHTPGITTDQTLRNSLLELLDAIADIQERLASRPIRR